eukprot:3256230-Alexandrium_andersonii.AAC.1
MCIRDRSWPASRRDAQRRAHQAAPPARAGPLRRGPALPGMVGGGEGRRHGGPQRAHVAAR